MSFPKNDVVKYRLDRARETYAEATLLRSDHRLTATVNRLYYAAFYAISAYFVQQDLKAFTHSGLKSAFNKELILTGKIPANEGRVFNQLFSYRQDADYKDFVQFEEDQIDLLFPQVKNLIDLLEHLIVNELG
jgi:hypothetical protein